MNKASLLGLALLAVGLSACRGAAPPAEAPLAGAKIGGPFALVDQDGRRFASTRLKGRYPIVYFGYTFCPDVCPTDMQVLGQGLRAFEKSDPARAAKVQPIFITVDPARDTPAALKQFVRAFHPRLIGLTGTEAEIGAVAKEYAVSYGRHPAANGAAGYLVDHSRASMLFGPDGQPIALVPTDAKPADVAATLDQWVR